MTRLTKAQREVLTLLTRDNARITLFGNLMVGNRNKGLVETWLRSPLLEQHYIAQSLDSSYRITDAGRAALEAQS